MTAPLPLAANPSPTIRGLEAELAARGVAVSHGAVWAFLHRAAQPGKTALASEMERPAFARRRARWRRYQGRIDPRRPVLLDETRVKTTMAPLRGWGPPAARPPGRHPHGRWHRPSFIAALRMDRIDAPCLFEGPINGETLTAWVMHSPTRTLSPGDVAIVDNLARQKGPDARAAIRAAGARRPFLPPAHPT